jgi:hypothetical protein
MRVPIAGGAAATIASDQSGLGGLALDASRLFWSNSTSVIMLPLAGGSATTIATGGRPVEYRGGREVRGVDQWRFERPNRSHRPGGVLIASPGGSLRDGAGCHRPLTALGISDWSRRPLPGGGRGAFQPGNPREIQDEAPPSSRARAARRVHQGERAQYSGPPTPPRRSS